MKTNLIRFGLSLMAVLFTTVTAMAQDPAAASGDTSRGLGYLAAGVGFAIAAGLCGLGQSKVAAAASWAAISCQRQRLPQTVTHRALLAGADT